MKLWLITLFCWSCCIGQNLLQTNVVDFVGVDIYDNYYYLQNNSLHKSGSTNDYQNLKYGTPDGIDISNPLQILVFYKFFNKVVALDNRLNFIAAYNVPMGTDLIASAGENKIWTYNNILKVLSIYNLKTEKTEISSIPITNKITQLKGNLNKAIVKTETNELETYNFVARKTSSKKLKHQLLPISMHSLYILQNNTLYKETTQIISVPDSINSYEVQNNVLYYLKDSNIYKTPIKQP